MVTSGYPEPGKTTRNDSSEKIDLDNVALNGGFLMKTIVLSIDPYMRGCMREASVQSYAVRNL
jgi:NADPH-dependent curcumin reductase CurA